MVEPPRQKSSRVKQLERPLSEKTRTEVVVDAEGAFLNEDNRCTCAHGGLDLRVHGDSKIGKIRREEEVQVETRR